MNNISTTNPAEAAILHDLGQQAQYYAKSVVANTIQLGRVLTEAKQLVKHGEWEEWVRDNAGCSLRNAQQFMATFARFGSNSDIAQLTDRSKVFAMLSLPPGAEEEFLAGNDVGSMSVRAVKEAVKQFRQEPAEEPERDDTGIADAQAEEIKRLKSENERLGQNNFDMLSELSTLRREKNALQHEVDEQNSIIEEMQRDYDSLRYSGGGAADCAPPPEDKGFDLDTLVSSVNRLMTNCGEMPTLHHMFANMPESMRMRYEEQLHVVDCWVRDSLSALHTIAYEEG